MPSKSYQQLSLPSQELIDAAIYYTEAFRLIEGKDWDDERDVFASDQQLLVNYLRGLYALDMQTSPPRYFDWHGEGRAIINTALKIQEMYATPHGDDAAMMLHNALIGPELGTLVEHLDNMPYPQTGKGDKLGR